MELFRKTLGGLKSKLLYSPFHFWRDNFNILYLHLYAESFWDEGG